MRCLLVITIIALAVGATSLAEGPKPASQEAGIEFFEKKIRPVLVQHCYECHSGQAKKQKGGLALDTRAAIRKGGDSGPALTPNKPDESLIIKAVRHADDLKMPPKKKLPDAVIADLEAWVKMGAPDPRDKAQAAPVTVTWEEMLRTRRQWWSLQPVKKTTPPAVKNPGEHPVDRFLLAGLEKAGLTPATPADPRTLIRRLSLVLTGLPPTSEEVEAFLKDCGPSSRAPQPALIKLVDRLLASPHFGERWARHWMDVVRFSETHGNEWNYEVHHAWRYRDYLIRAFNDDVPYDQLVREHIAGDLLAKPRWNTQEHFNESVIGTAFYRFGEVNHDDCIALRQIGFDLADNQIDTLGKAFQATTIACARCHDHKIDAVSLKDYYGLLGIIRSSRQVSHTIDGPEVNAEPMRKLRDLKGEIRKELGEAWARDARSIGPYLLAAQARLGQQADAADLAKGLDAKRLDAWVAALKLEKPPLEDPLSPWRTLAAVKVSESSPLAAEWRRLAESYEKESQQRQEFNAKSFTTFADFRSPGFAGWQVGGHGLRDGTSRGGDFALHAEGDALVRAVLPAGSFTHALSDKLNGTLRSPLLPNGHKHISFQVLGQRSSAVRLVSNNCQLNYKNYRALINDNWHWITFQPPVDCDRVRVYAELMTLLDNPKFPDQLSALGGDKENYRLPWEKAAANPRSHFGIRRVVFHDSPEPPRAELGHFRSLFANGPKTAAPVSLPDVAARYASVCESAVQSWAADKASEEDVTWLDSLVRRGLVGNSAALTPRLEKLITQYRDTEKTLALPRIVPGVADFGAGFEQPIFIRGDCMRAGDPTGRRYLEVLSRPGEPFSSAGSGRLDLAERIASPDNPLTARVMVNRVWHHLFGAGLVRTTDDFGRVGELPSHPELLDYLATQFKTECQWSIKKLIRTVVLTQAFQMASMPSASAREKDPENRLLQHYPARRMEAETIRDSILAASGRLDRTLFGHSVQPYREKENADRRLFPGPLDGNGRRGVYIKNNLMEGPKFLSAFNFPGGKVAQGRRDVTNVPAQALALLNDPFVHQQAGVWAARLVTRSDASPSARIEHMFQTALSRPPTDAERTRFEKAVADMAAIHGVPAADVLKSPAVWQDLAHALFNVKEFIYIR